MVKIADVLKTSVIDYNKGVSYVVFFQGCNLKCNFCYNFQLIPKNPLLKKYIDEEEVISYLNKNKKWYDAVVLLGGEPTIQKDIENFCKRVKKETGLLIKLDTNGLRPDVVKNLINKKLIDYVAVDIKTITINNEDYLHTKDIIVHSKIDHEFRLTCVPTIINDNNIKEILGKFKDVKKIYLQNFSNSHTLDKKLEKVTPYDDTKLIEWSNLFTNVFVR